MLKFVLRKKAGQPSSQINRTHFLDAYNSYMDKKKNKKKRQEVVVDDHTLWWSFSKP